jgi:hypothetical protein
MNESLDRSCDLLDRSVRINAVLREQIAVIRAKPR